MKNLFLSLTVVTLLLTISANKASACSVTPLDIEKVTEKLRATEEGHIVFDSFFKHVKGVASKVIVDGQYIGTVVAYPFVMDSFTEGEAKELKAQMVECGVNEANETAKLLKRVMETAGNRYLKNVPVIAEVSISDSWAGK